MAGLGKWAGSVPVYHHNNRKKCRDLSSSCCHNNENIFNGGYSMNPYLNSAILFMPSITITLSAKMDQVETILEKNQLYGLY